MGRGRALTVASPRGRQCRQPEPLARIRRTPAPRAGGGCAAFRFGWGGGGSRRRQAHEQGPAACGALGDAALPRWARGAAGVRGRRCLPCGQRRCRVARWIMACRGRERGFRSGLPIRELYRRAGERGNGPHPAGDGDTRHLADRTRPSPGKTFRIILPPQTRRSTRHASLPVAENLPGARPRPAFHACLRPIRACLRPIRACLRPIPCHLRPSHTFCGLLMSLAAVPCLLLPIRAFMAFCAICGAFPALYDFPTPAYGHSAPFAAHPAPFTTFPHLLRPLRAFYCLSAPVSVLFAPLTAIPCLFTAACLRAIPHLFIAYPRLSWPFTTCPTPFAAHPRLLRSSRARLRPVHTLYGPSRACLRTFCTFYAIPRPQKSASHPSRHRLISQTIPQGERRALPAPAQGANPLRIPFWKTTSIASVSPSPKTPQADGPCSWAVRRVYALSPE